MLGNYVQAFFPPPAVVLNRRLRAFSLGHSFILDALGNPFEAGGKHTAADLAQFVWVCSRPFSEAVNALSSATSGEPESWPPEKAWGEECGESLDFAAESDKAIDYQAAALAVPKRWRDIGAGKSSGPKVPWQLAVFQTIRGESAITPEVEAAIWDMPIGRATSYAAAAAWASGDDSLMSEAEEEGLRVLQELEQAEGSGSNG